MAPNSPKIGQLCLILMLLVHLRGPFISGYSFNTYLGQSPLPQPPQSNVYQNSPYFANVVNFQPTPFNNHNHNGFKYNGVYYTSSPSNANSNDNTNANNAILSNQQIANAPIVTSFNNAVENNEAYNPAGVNQKIGNTLHHNAISNNNLRSFDNQNILHQLNNNVLNSQNQISNNQFAYNQLPNYPYANNYHFHPALTQNQIPQGVAQSSGNFKPQNQGVFQHPGLFTGHLSNYGKITNQGQISPQTPGQRVFQNPINAQRIVPNQINNQGIVQNQVNNQGIIQNQITTHPILKYSIPSTHYQQSRVENQQSQLGNHGTIQHAEQLPNHQNSIDSFPPQIQSSVPPQIQTPIPPQIQTPIPPQIQTPIPPQIQTSIPPQIQSPVPPTTNDQLFQHPVYEPVLNNSVLQTVPETVTQPRRISGAILGQTREVVGQNSIEPLQTLSSQEISDAEFYSKQEPPRFPPLMDQGDADNEEYRRRGLSRSNQPGQVQLQPLVHDPDVPPGCAYNAVGTGSNGENCIQIK